MPWDTLDLLHTAFDDPSAPHTVTVKAYDGSGNVTTSAVSVYVDNTAGTRYSAAFDLNAPGPADDYIPPVMPNSTTTTSTDSYSGGGAHAGLQPGRLHRRGGRAAAGLRRCRRDGLVVWHQLPGHLLLPDGDGDQHQQRGVEEQHGQRAAVVVPLVHA